MIRRRFSVWPFLLGLCAVSAFGILLFVSRRAPVCGTDNDPRIRTEITEMEFAQYLFPVGRENTHYAENPRSPRYIAGCPLEEAATTLLFITTSPAGARIGVNVASKWWYLGLSPVEFSAPCADLVISADLAGHLPASCPMTAGDLGERRDVRISLKRDEQVLKAAARARTGAGEGCEETALCNYSYDSQSKILSISDRSDQPVRWLGRVASQPKANGKSLAFTYCFELQGEVFDIPAFAYLFDWSIKMTYIGDRENPKCGVALYPFGRFGVVKDGCRASVFDLVDSRLLWSVEVAGDWTPYRDDDLLVLQLTEDLLLFDVFSGTRL